MSIESLILSSTDLIPTCEDSSWTSLYKNDLKFKSGGSS